MFGQKVFITDEDMMRLYDFILIYKHDEINDIMEKLEYIKEYIEADKVFKEKINELNNTYFKKEEEKDGE